MAIIWADFPSGQHGLYDTNTSYMLNGVWAQLVQQFSGTTTLVNDPDPNIGSAGRVLRTFASGNSSQGSARFALPAPAATEGFGFRIWMGSLPDRIEACPWVAFRNTSNVTLFALRFLPNGAIQARTGSGSENGTSGTSVGETAGPVVTANAWGHVEIKGTANASAGEIEVRVNGISVLALTTLNTGSVNIAQIAFGVTVNINAVVSAPTTYWKDVVFWDTAGSVGNDFQGSVAVYDLLTDEDVSFNWVASSGSTGFNLINETPPVDTSYIEADATPPAASIFGLTTLPDDVTSVRALLPVYRATKTDGGDCNLQVSLSPNGTDWADGADRPITTSFTYWWDVSAVSPDTGLPWSVSEVNTDLTVKFNRTL